jgi:hypothetical protein
VSDIDTAVVDSLTCLTPDGRLEKRTLSSVRVMSALPPKADSALSMSALCHKPTCGMSGTHLTCSARALSRSSANLQASLFQPRRTRATAETMQIIPKMSAKAGKAEGKRQNAAKNAMVSEPSAIPPR